MAGVESGIDVLYNLKLSLCQVLKSFTLTAHAVIAEFRGHIPAALLQVEVQRRLIPVQYSEVELSATSSKTKLRVARSQTCQIYTVNTAG